MVNCKDIVERLREEAGKGYMDEYTCDDALEAADRIFQLQAERNHLLKIAHEMHLWIFNNTCDEQAAYDECGLSDEDNALLGYGGQFVIFGKEGANEG